MKCQSKIANNKDYLNRLITAAYTIHCDHYEENFLFDEEDNLGQPFRSILFK
jgi:hypothetical protein